MELLNPSVDLAFKKIFGSEENKDLLISLINSIVSEEDQVTEVHLLNPYNSKNFKKDKLSILDIKAKDLKGMYYNIEVQITDEGDYTERALYYWAKVYTDQLGTGEPYENLKKTIGIHILNFVSIPAAPDYHNTFFITNKASGKRYPKNLELITIELSKFTSQTNENLTQILPRIKTGLDRWAAFLTKAANLISQKTIPEELNDPLIQKAVNVLINTSLNSDEREMYEDHLKWLRIEASALKKAEKVGEERGKAIAEAKAKAENIKIAKELLNQGMSIELVCNIIKISKEEILNYPPLPFFFQQKIHSFFILDLN